MFDSYQQSTGREYTTSVALLAIAFIFSPAVLIASGSFSALPLSLAIACSALCATLAWLKWKN